MQFPLFKPPVEWVVPDGYPDLSEAKEVAIDLETKDPNLTTMGSGWPRKDGHIIGIAVAVEGDQWYFPIRHEIGSNLDPKMTMNWLRDVCSVIGIIFFITLLMMLGGCSQKMCLFQDGSLTQWLLRPC